jgi:hypothetical protein
MGGWIYISTFSWPRHLLEASGQLHANGPLYPVVKRLCGSQGRYERGGEQNILDPTGTRTRTSGRPVAIPTAVSRLPINFKYMSKTRIAKPLDITSYWKGLPLCSCWKRGSQEIRSQVQASPRAHYTAHSTVSWHLSWRQGRSNMNLTATLTAEV